MGGSETNAHISTCEHSRPLQSAGNITDEMVVEAIAALRSRLLADAVQEHDVVDVEEA